MHFNPEPPCKVCPLAHPSSLPGRVLCACCDVGDTGLGGDVFGFRVWARRLRADEVKDSATRGAPSTLGTDALVAAQDAMASVLFGAPTLSMFWKPSACAKSWAKGRVPDRAEPVPAHPAQPAPCVVGDTSADNSSASFGVGRSTRLKALFDSLRRASSRGTALEVLSQLVDCSASRGPSHGDVHPAGDGDMDTWLRELRSLKARLGTAWDVELATRCRAAVVHLRQVLSR